jgi:hypothetical protein
MLAPQVFRHGSASESPSPLSRGEDQERLAAGLRDSLCVLRVGGVSSGQRPKTHGRIHYGRQTAHKEARHWRRAKSRENKTPQVAAIGSYINSPSVLWQFTHSQKTPIEWRAFSHGRLRDVGALCRKKKTPPIGDRAGLVVGHAPQRGRGADPIPSPQVCGSSVAGCLCGSRLHALGELGDRGAAAAGLKGDRPVSHLRQMLRIRLSATEV